MIDLKDIKPVPYSDPWQISYATRFKALTAKSIKIAYFYERADNSTFRYRIYNPTQVLNELSQDISASYFFLSDATYFDDIAACADILVICRARYCDNVNRIIGKFKNKGKPVFFDVDDLVFDCKYAHFIANNNAMNLESSNHWDDWFGYISRIGLTLSLCDSVITTNKYLADKIHEFSSLPVEILPNFMNKEQISISNAIYSHKKNNQSQEKKNINIGYFSGSPTHAKDFEVAAPALKRLLARRTDVSLTLAGYLDQEEMYAQFPKQISKIPFHDYVNLQRVIGSVEINIAPLQHNIFTNCKSELKYFEAAIVGTVTIATPIYTFSNAIADGTNGYLCSGADWDDKLELAIAALDTDQSIIANGQQHAEQHYSWIHQLDAVKKSLRLKY